MQISTLISKPVLSPAGDGYGYVTEVRLSRDYQKISCLVCADEEEEEFYVPLRAVLFFSDAVIVGRGRITNPTGICSPIGKRAYKLSGEALGNISDVTLDEATESMLVISNGTTQIIAPASCAFINENAVLYPDASAKAHAKRRAKISTNSSTPKAPSKKRLKMEKEETITEIERADTKERQATKSEILNRTNLLGRHVRRSVYDATGLPIAIVGEQITPAILNAARRAGRLLELTVNTLTNFR